MNQKIWELFEAKKILLRDLKTIDTKEFSSKKTLEIFWGVDEKKFYNLIFLRTAKSRLLRKEALELEEICKKIETKFQISLKKKIIFYSSEICSKALKELQKSNWRCYDFM
ncbi:hypothetical protein [Campylobacter concisus]|jgi:hypothetical protein|uniref:hypothetical protein n=2 Tax=Campylobacter concisus TaxID=199 RepID=UPI000CD84A91|nr:hypothetical protein [Campylobacter concisus]